MVDFLRSLPLMLVAPCAAPGTQPDATRAVDGAQLADNRLRSLVFGVVAFLLGDGLAYLAARHLIDRARRAG